MQIWYQLRVLQFLHRYCSIRRFCYEFLYIYHKTASNRYQLWDWKATPFKFSFYFFIFFLIALLNFEGERERWREEKMKKKPWGQCFQGFMWMILKKEVHEHLLETKWLFTNSLVYLHRGSMAERCPLTLIPPPTLFHRHLQHRWVKKHLTFALIWSDSYQLMVILWF